MARECFYKKYTQKEDATKDVTKRTNFFRMNQYWCDNILAISCFIIATFPFLGNVIAYPAETGVRRKWQIGILVLGLVGVGAVFFADVTHNQKKCLSRQSVQAVLLALLAFGLICVFNTWYHGFFPEGRMLLKAGIVAGWLSLTAMMFANRDRLIGKCWTADQPESSMKPFKIFLVLFSLIAVLKAWMIPPPFNEVYLAFDGSYIQSGMCAVIGYFIVLLLFPYWYGMFASLPFGYLFVLSTSRTSWISCACLFVFLWFIWWRNERYRHFRAFIVATAKITGLIVALMLLIIAPIYSSSTYYPYLIKVPDPPNAQMIAYDRTQEFSRRVSRLLRIIPGGNLIASQIRTVIPQHYTESINASRQSSDDRVNILLSSLSGKDAGIIKYLTGVWPIPFREKIGSTIYTYPHNSILETAFYWGWPLTVLIWAGFFGLVCLGILRATLQGRVLRIMLTVIAIEFALIIQVSGAIEDFANLMILAWIMFVTSLSHRYNEC